MTKAEVWVDVSTLTPAETPDALAYLRSSPATVLLMRYDQFAEWQPIERLRTACLVGEEEAERLAEIAADDRVGAVHAGRQRRGQPRAQRVEPLGDHVRPLPGGRGDL